MKIQGLAVIAIVIILPMSIILNSYSSNQIKTLDFQISYDTRLLNSTYDGIKAFQLNMSNSATSNIADSKMRDIKASIKAFYNSLSSNFSMSGYGEDVLQNYVPAVVYTLYDGYYIYSDYKNTLDVYEERTNPEGDIFYTDATYKDGEDIYGLKPYIYYSCRYKRDNFDVVITYSLDSYVRIQGTVNGKIVDEAGYLLTGADSVGGDVKYRGITINEEKNNDLRQNVYLSSELPEAGDEEVEIGDETVGIIRNCQYRKIDGTKYYKANDNTIFYMQNDKRIPFYEENGNKIENNNGAKEFYSKAYDFKQNFKFSGDLSALNDLSSNDAVDSQGHYYKDKSYYPNNPYSEGVPVFSELYGDQEQYIEDENSNFNMHRKEVIKNSIESNLIVAIANYNKVSTSDVRFAMPKLKDEEWEELTTNISMITFLQGLNIGGKVYSGYAIVPNDINEDFVSEDSIYITVDGTYYRVTDEKLLNLNLDEAVGLINTDFERRAIEETDSAGNKQNIFYFPRKDEGSYTSIIDLNSNNGMKEILKAHDINSVTSSNPTMRKLAEIYYTALGRERYGMSRVNSPFPRNLEELR